MNLMKLFNFKYGKQTLKKNISILSILFLVIPILSLLVIYNYSLTSYANPFDIRSIIIPNIIGMFIIPFILSNILLGYVYSQKQVDFINSMPISRKKIFLTNILIGILYLIIMQLFTLIASSIFITSANILCVSFEMLLDVFTVMTIGYIFIFTVSMFAVAVTGNTFIQFALVLLFLFLVPFIRIVDINLLTRYSNDYIDFIRPDGKTIQASYFEYDVYNNYDNIYLVPMNSVLTLLNSNKIYNEKSLCLTVAASFVFIILGVYAFNKRKMEDSKISFASSKIHLLVKMLTVYPIIRIIYLLFRNINLIQGIFVIIVIALYYYLFDIITCKKIKPIPNLLVLILCISLSSGIIYVETKYNDNYNRENIDINSEDIEKLEVNSLIGFNDWIHESFATKEDRDNFLNSLVSYDKEVDEDYVSICIRFLLKSGKRIALFTYIEKGQYYMNLEKIKNNDAYINELLLNEFNISDDYLVILYNNIANLKVGETNAIKEALNNHLRDYIRYYLYNDEILNNNRSNKINTYMDVFKYENHEQILIPITEASILGDDVTNEIVTLRNKLVLDDKDLFKYMQTIEFTLFDDIRIENANIKLSIDEKEILKEFMKNDSKKDFDCTKPFYKIENYYYTNDIEGVNSIIDNYIKNGFFYSSEDYVVEY